MNASLRVIQIVPRLGSVLDGVGDHALRLGRALESTGDMDVRFLSCSPMEGQTPQRNDETILAERSSGALKAALNKMGGDASESAVLVHYVNYAYGMRGCPVWLITGLREWKREASHIRMVTMFHELYASGPPWRSSFWLSPVQRHLTRKLRNLSSEVVTNREQSRRWLMRTNSRPHPRVSVLPVFSNLGETRTPTDWRSRSPYMVVVGRSGERQRAYGRLRDRLLEACRALDIERIIDIGHRSAPVPDRIGEIPISARGHLDADEAHSILTTARAGFVDYPTDFLGKSGVFAAYAAHGLVPVVSWKRGEDEAGLAEGLNYWVPSGDARKRDFEAIARLATEWYRTHSLDRQASVFAELLRGHST